MRVFRATMAPPPWRLLPTMVALFLVIGLVSAQDAINDDEFTQAAAGVPAEVMYGHACPPDMVPCHCRSYASGHRWCWRLTEAAVANLRHHGHDGHSRQHDCCRWDGPPPPVPGQACILQPQVAGVSSWPGCATPAAIGAECVQACTQGAFIGQANVTCDGTRWVVNTPCTPACTVQPDPVDYPGIANWSTCSVPAAIGAQCVQTCTQDSYTGVANVTCDENNEWILNEACTPAAPDVLTALAPGYRMSCVVKQASAYCLGVNNRGQLGNGNQVTPQTTPQAVVGIEGAVKELITSPYQFTCALLINDTVTCWGSNSLGQLGRGSIGGDFPTPAPVLGFNPGVGVRSVTLAAESTFIVFNNGSAVSFGSCGSGTLGNGCLGSAGNTGTPTPMGLSNVDSIAAGDYHACALFTGGSVSCWGSNGAGQLGPGGSVGTSTGTPVAVTGLNGPAKQIAAGASHSCALLTSGSVQCWGSQTRGQLGNGVVGGINPTPQTVQGLNGVVTAISAGDGFTCALLQDTTVQCWGFNNANQLGNPDVPPATCLCSATPWPVIGLSGVLKISTGETTAMALLPDGVGVAWGNNANGILFSGPPPPTSSAEPIIVNPELIPA